MVRPDPIDELRHWVDSGEARRRRVRGRQTQAQAARKLRVSKDTFWRWETGYHFPRGDNATRYHTWLRRIGPATGEVSEQA